MVLAHSLLLVFAHAIRSAGESEYVPPATVRLLHPPQGAHVYRSDFKLSVAVQPPTIARMVGVTGGVELCVSLNHSTTGELTSACLPADESSRANEQGVVTTHMIDVMVKGVVRVVLTLRNGGGVLNRELSAELARSESLFQYVLHPRCQERIARSLTEQHGDLSGSYRVRYHSSAQKSGLNAAHDGVSVDGSGNGAIESGTPGFGSLSDPFAKQEFSPLCAEDGLIEYLPPTRSILATNSGMRGSFGLGFAFQEFGWGDKILLEHVLLRHGPVHHIVELGTFHGVTSLQLALTALVHGGSLHAFDIEDQRLPVVRDGMSRLGARFTVCDLDDLNKPPPAEALAAARKASLLIVDAGNRLLEAIRYGGVLCVGCVLFVHDFPSILHSGRTNAGIFTATHGKEQSAIWDECMRIIGFERRYKVETEHFTSEGAVYVRKRTTAAHSITAQLSESTVVPRAFLPWFELDFH